MATKELRVGIVGYGMMGRAHAYAYRAAPLIRPSSVVFRPVVMSGRNAEAVARASVACGVDEWVTDWRELVARDDVDVVDVCTPPGTHAAIIEAAASAGKDVFCEKPLATNYEDARSALDAVTERWCASRDRIQLPPIARGLVDGRDDRERRTGRNPSVARHVALR